MSLLTPTLIIDEYAKIKKTREFFTQGKILVSVGDTVTSDSSIAEFEEKGDLQFVRISEKHSLNENEFLSGLLIKEGDIVSENEIIFRRKSLFGLLTIEERTSIAGVIEVVSPITGAIGIRAKSKIKNLLSYLSGEVKSVTNASVTIESTACVIQGVFGVGGEKTGTLHTLNISNEKQVAISDIPQDCSKLVLVGGTQPSGKVLLEAQRRGAVGFITAGIGDAALTEFLGFEIGLAITGNEPCTMSIVVTDGFGNLTFSKKVSEYFNKYSGTKVSINGTTQVRAGAVRPEIIIFHTMLPPTKSLIPDKELIVGAIIRGTRAPFFGQEGEVVELPVELEKLPTGVHSRVVRVKNKQGEIYTIPRANVELV